MKLYWSSRSPYVRKVMIAAHETGLVDRLDCQRVIVSAFAENEEVRAVNPLGKIPTLVLDDGMALYDFPVICEYLDGLHDGPKLFPPSGRARFAALRWLALGDGMLDMLLARMYEQRTRTDDQRSAKLQAAIAVKLKTCLDALDAHGAGADRGALRHRPYRHRLRAWLSRFPLRRRRLARDEAGARGVAQILRRAPVGRRDGAGGRLLSRRGPRRSLALRNKLR